MISNRKKLFPNVTDEEWNSWHWQVKNRVTTLEQLKKYIKLTKEEEDGIAKTLKNYNDNIRIIGISPKTKLDNIPGLGANIVLPLLDNNTLDEIILVSEKDAIYTKQKLATEEGIFAGISSGAAMYGSLDIASRKENTGKNIITLFPDSGNRYMNII